MKALRVLEVEPFAEFIAEVRKHQTQTIKFAEMFLTTIVASNRQFEVNITNEETKMYLEEHGCLLYGVNSEYIRKLKLND